MNTLMGHNTMHKDGDVALPGIFARLGGLRLDTAEPVRIGGWAFRGLLNLSVKWDVL
jgi:hypothetical protein